MDDHILLAAVCQYKIKKIPPCHKRTAWTVTPEMKYDFLYGYKARRTRDNLRKTDTPAQDDRMGKTKSAQMTALAREVDDLTLSPLYEFRKRNGYYPVIGRGSLDARFMFIGEAPGESEAKTGQPFVGRAGRVLDRLLGAAGLDPETIYITNIVKDRPPGNRDPNQQEIDLYAPFLIRQIEIIQPRVLVTLGRFAMQFILKWFELPEAGKTIGELHGRVLNTTVAYGPLAIIALYHPAAAFYNRELEETLIDDLKSITTLLE